MEAEFRVIVQNEKMLEEKNKLASKVDAFLKDACNTKRGRPLVKILAETSKLPRNTKTSDNPSEPLL